MLNADSERKRVQLAAQLNEIEKNKETCRVELHFKNGALVDGNKFVGFLK